VIRLKRPHFLPCPRTRRNCIGLVILFAPFVVIAQEAGPDRLIEATRYAAFATDSVECRSGKTDDPIRDAIKWTALAIKTVRGFRTANKTDQGLAAAFLARQVRHLADLDSLGNGLDRSYRQIEDDITHHRLGSATKLQQDASPPVCDARFARLYSRLDELRNHVASIIAEADVRAATDLKGAIKLYEEAERLDSDDATIERKIQMAKAAPAKKALMVTKNENSSKTKRPRKRLPPSMAYPSGVELLQRAQAAMGGSSLREIRTSRAVVNGTYYPNGKTLHYTTRFVAPHHNRLDVQLASGTQSLYSDGSSGWQYSDGIAKPLTAKEVDDFVFYNLTDLIEADQNPSYQVNGIGPAAVGIQSSGGRTVLLRFDRSTSLPLSMSYTPDSTHGALVVSTLSDWRTINGVMVPFRIVIEVNGTKTREDIVEEAQVNIPLKSEDLAEQP
jgi:hypothetical protein